MVLANLKMTLLYQTFHFTRMTNQDKQLFQTLKGMHTQIAKYDKKSFEVNL